jgi:hypothetical protein
MGFNIYVFHGSGNIRKGFITDSYNPPAPPSIGKTFTSTSLPTTTLAPPYGNPWIKNDGLVKSPFI